MKQTISNAAAPWFVIIDLSLWIPNQFSALFLDNKQTQAASSSAKITNVPSQSSTIGKTTIPTNHQASQAQKIRQHPYRRLEKTDNIKNEKNWVNIIDADPYGLSVSFGWRKTSHLPC